MKTLHRMFVFIYRLLFCIPPLEKRPSKRFVLNQFAVPGYDPGSVESYILYKSFMLAFWIFVVSTGIYALPFILQNTAWAGFHVFPDFHHDLSAKPVDYYKYNFPRTISLPLIAITCAYAVILSYTTRTQHNWHFSGTRPVYLQNMARIRKKWFGFTRMALLHLGLPWVLAIAVYYMWAVPEFWNSYILTKAVHDFSVQTFGNLMIIAFLYLWFLPPTISNIFVFFILLFFEKIHSQTTTLMPIWRSQRDSD